MTDYKAIASWLLCALLMAPGHLEAQSPSSDDGPPEHPISEATLRKYFEVCHFALYNRENLEKQFRKQQQALPPWYPADVWSETVQAVEDIDVVPLALPVYQKYFSETAGINAIRLFATPQGQGVIKKVYESEIQSMDSGDSAQAARVKALNEEREREDATARQILNSMTAKDRQEMYLFLQSPEWKRINSMGDRIRSEYNVPYLAAQEKVEADIARRHADELIDARQRYEQAHAK